MPRSDATGRRSLSTTERIVVIVGILCLLVVIIIANESHKKREAERLAERERQVQEQKERDAERAAALKRQAQKEKEASNMRQLAQARDLVDSGQFKPAYEMMIELPDSLVRHEREDIRKRALRQALVALDIETANVLLAASRTQDSSYVQAVQALDAYSSIDKELHEIHRDTLYLSEEIPRLREELRSRRKTTGYIVKRFSDDLYECRYTGLTSSDFWLRGAQPGIQTRILDEIFLLVTVQTAFTSKGHFALYLKEGGTRTIETVDGFTKTVDVLIEDTEAESEIKQDKAWLKEAQEEWKQMREKIPQIKKSKREACKQLMKATRALGLSAKC